MKKRNLKKPMISALEQRILFDGAAVATAVDVLDESSFSSNNDVTQNNAENSVHEAQAVQGFERDRREVAFVDITVKDYQTLVDGIGEGVEVYLVSSLDDINSILKSETNIDAIHILSHGNVGEITVGNDVLNQNTLNNFDTVLQTMKNSLSENGDILLYGCNVASDGTGQEFIDTLALITQADIAASDNITGNSALGGDWVLEKNSGIIETDSFEISKFNFTLVTPPDGLYTFANAVDNGGGTFRTADGFFIISANDGSSDNIDDPVAADQYGAYINDSVANVSGTSYIQIAVNGGGSFRLTNAVIGDYEGNGNSNNNDFYNIYAVGYANGTQVAITPAKTSVGFYSTDLNFDFSNFIGKTIDTFRVYYSWDAGNTIQTGFNLESITIAGASTTPAGPSDTTPPTFDVTPATSNVTATTLDLSASLDEAGKIYYVVVPDGATAPSVAQILAGLDSTGASALKSGNSDVTISPFDGTFNITGLTANTAYDIYVVAQDDEGTPNVMTTATKVDVTTTTLNILYDFESNVSGVDTKTVTQTILGIPLTITSETLNIKNSDETSGQDIAGSTTLATDYSIGFETKLTFSTSGYTFNLDTFKIYNADGINVILRLTSINGSYDFSPTSGSVDTITVSAIGNSSDFTNISSFTLEYISGSINNGMAIDFDNIYLTNILPIIGPTVSAEIGTYTDTSVNDTGFTNTTGNISATPSSGSIIGYGIDTGTTGGTTNIGGTIYDVSKAGTYGTLYVNSSTGAYVYVPTSDSVINATSSTVTDTFTIQATDSNGTGNGTLTITINGVNDTPELSTPTSASYIDTSATDTFSNTTGTLSASDADAGTTLTYGISTGVTGGTDNIGGIIYDISKVGTYGTLYVKSSDGSYVYVPNANAINALTSNTTDIFTVSVSDGSLSDTKTFTVDITGVNDTPSATDKTITIDEDTPTLLSVSDFGFIDIDTGSALASVKIVSLPNNGILQYYDGASWVAVIANQVITNADITANKLRFNPALNENGTTYATFDFTVNDGTVDSSAKTITYNVTAVNDAPTVANAITDQNASVSNAFSFEVPLNTFTDVDTSDTLTYTAQLVDSNGDLVSGGTLPSWLSFDANTRTFSGTPAIGDAGIIYIKVTATDNGVGNLSVSDTFTITTIANKTPIAGFGTGLTFDGSSNYVTVTDSGYTITNTLTMEAWINPTSTAGVQHIMGKWTPLGTSDSVHNSDGYLVAILNGKIAVFLSNNGTNEQNFSSNSSVSSNTWTHVSLTFDSGVAKLYINGVLDKEVNVSGITSLHKSSQDLSIGATHTSSGTSYYFNGQIDEARIWNIARPSTDIQNDMYQTLSGNETGLVGYWNMDEATGTTLVDSSVNSNNGTLVNTPTFTNSNISMSISLDEDTSVSIQTFGGSDADNNGSTQTDTISVKITTLPTNGKLFQTTDGTTSNGTEITSIGTVVTHSGGKVIYIPNENYNGSDSFSYKVNDGAVDSNNTISQNITINSVNDVPTATDKTITINEDTPTLLSVSDFGFSDVENDTFTSVKITNLATHGMLEYNNGTSWVAVSLNQVITATDITDGKLRFNPALNENGTTYATFDFTVNDGTTDSVNANTITYNVTAINDAPTAIDKTITINEDTPTLLSVSDFGFSDVENDTFTSVKITNLATHGMLEYNNGTSWVAVSLNQVITATDITDGKLRFNPALNENGTAYATFDFTVNDGTTDSVNANTITYNVTAVNDAPEGTVSISGTVTQGQTLTASNNITDADGMGTISYQWYADGVLINGAVNSTYTLTQNEVNKVITVKASYTDGEGTAETVTSSATTSVTNLNDAPVGTVSISGTVTQGQTLTASNNITDADGMGTISYQWYADGVLINGAVNSTYTLTQNEVNKVITVKASYTDGEGTAETVTSSATTSVTNLNDAPVGTVSISGTVTQGQTLTASNNITDADGMGTISYQWYADGVLINGAVNSTYTLTQNEVNKVITVKASYTDGFGANESVTSSATASVVNVNDAPTVSNDNIDVKLSFGDAYQKDVSGLFSDIDFDNVFTYEAINLPLGLTMNSSTGVISGRANSSGEFKVIIKVTDNGTPALSVSRTYNMLVVAPPQVEVSQNTSPKPSVDNTPIVNVNNITISTFTDTLSLGTINNNLGDTPADSVGNGYIDSNRENNNQENNNQPLQVNRTNSSNYIEANASLNVGFNGQISFDNTAQDSFSIVGIAIENMTIENNRLEIRVVDTNLAQNFIVTQIDGTALPTGLSFDPKTGSISGTIPENLDKLEITIKATNQDGTTRVLNLKLDLKELKKSQANQADADEKYMGLKEQIALENQKLDDYGSYLTRLFA